MPSRCSAPAANTPPATTATPATVSADTIATSQALGKSVSVCGEMAGDVSMTKLLIGLGLRSFSMHPSQILAVKQEVLRADSQRLRVWAQQVLEADEPALLMGPA